ncbi:NAD-binding protein [Streptomyces sp. NPDC005181]|uniref:NAD-binding protein n=1 Tax=Streptomyces sp. NPDC005181 TaxID=3156869 RepID=UPI0033A8B279
MTSIPHFRTELGPRSQHMVICGDDGLARRLAVEPDAVCGEAVTVVLPSRRDEHGAEIAALHRDPHSPIELLVATHSDEQTLRAAGVPRAAALALTYADDQANMTAALLARGLNPSIRLVIRMFNRERGRHLERLLDRAAAEARGGSDDDPRPDMSTTVLSDADTAVPELVAAAAVGHGHTLQVEGKVFRGVVRAAGAPPRSPIWPHAPCSPARTRTNRRVGLGKIGTRVLAQLRTTDHKVVAVERDPNARGVALARELDVPLVLEDAGAPGVLDRARIRHSKSLLVLTRDDSENLDIVMAARETTPSVRVVMRLYDDDFAATVQRTLRAFYPQAPTRSRSVSALAAPSFAAAMMGRHVLGVMPVERGSLLFTVVDVAGIPRSKDARSMRRSGSTSGGSWRSARPWPRPRRPRRMPSPASGSANPASTGARHTGGFCVRATASCWRRRGVAWTSS